MRHGEIASQIALSPRLDQLLCKDRELRASVDSAISVCSSWFGDNKTPFFPGYTDHGVAHISNVISSAELLVAEDTWQLLTPEDAAAIVCACLLHDCGMHLTVDGFWDLLGGDFDFQSAPFSEERICWSEKFTLFQQEAARWDAARLLAVFGEQEAIPHIKAQTSELSPRQLLFIGEFVRREHAMLAQAVAVRGVPGPESRSGRLAPLSGFDEHQRKMFGFLARSHNLPIRKAADALPSRSRRFYLRVHGPFVMAVLRVADYIQISRERAPQEILRTRKLVSPLSRNEWAKHRAVLDLHLETADPEALMVEVRPETIDEFCGLSALFKDLQRELDETWATIGEVYGRGDSLKGMGLSVRRLRSNLEDVQKYEREEQPKFIPRPVRLSTASTDLLNLLVAPLYGNRPSVGVRELIQNAIDAHLERVDLDAGNPSLGRVLVNVIELDNNESSVEVIDTGVGMSLETVENFFLRVGASFRSSDWWLRSHQSAEGRSRVRRTGRFGVGVLAAFLIGQKISVTTRSFQAEEDDGISFTLQLDQGLVELRRVRAPIGTSIKVSDISAATMSSLLDSDKTEIGFNDWYCFTSPQVDMRVLRQVGTERRQARLSLDPDAVLAGEDGWNVVDVENFELVAWKYKDRKDYRNSNFISCNGFIVSASTYRFPDIQISEKGSGFELGHPSLVIIDKDGRLPLNLQRDQLAEPEYPFQEELSVSIAASFVGRMREELDRGGSLAQICVRLRSLYLKYWGSIHYRGFMPVFGVGNEWAPSDAGLLAKRAPENIIIDFIAGADYDSGSDCLADSSGFVSLPSLNSGFTQQHAAQFMRALFQNCHLSFDCFGRAPPQLAGAIAFLHREYLEKLSRKSVVPQFIWDKISEVGTFW